VGVPSMPGVYQLSEKELVKMPKRPMTRASRA
jgi:hypothetical protein